MFDPTTGLNFNHQRDQEQDRSIVEFFSDAVQNDFKSAQEGRPVFEEVEKVRIIIPGDKRTEVIEKVKAEHRERWASQYSKFKANQEQAPEGTPVEEWPPINKAWAMNLKSLNIRTVEQLAAVTDAAVSNIGMGGRDLRDKAIAWLSQAAGGQPLAEALAREQRLTDELAVQSAQVAELTALVNSLKKEPAA